MVTSLIAQHQIIQGMRGKQGQKYVKWGRKRFTYLVLVTITTKIPQSCISPYNVWRSLRNRALWVLFHRLTHIYIFSVKINYARHVPDLRAIVMSTQRLMGNVIAQTPTLGSLSWSLFQVSLILLVWERPGILKVSRNLRRRKEG